MPNVRSCEIVSRLTNDDNEVLFDLENLKKVLEEKSHIISEFAYIIHDKDTYSENDEALNPQHKANSLKPKHIHLALKFERNQPQKTKYIAKWFNIPEQFVSKIKGKWKDCICYLTHQNAPNKYQYEISDVIANFNIETVIEHVNSKGKVNEIVQRILSGDIKEYNKTIEIDSILLVNPSTSKVIENAFKVRAEYLQTTKTNRNTTCIYISGKSGAGKTTLAKKIANENALDYYISSGSNDIMDGYCQQPCLILDDIRPSCLGLSDLLKLLDPYTASSIKSRYKNKYLNPDLIILTSVLPIEEFYHNVFENENEPITQLMRRCKLYITMDMSTIKIRRWNDILMCYSNPLVYSNDIITEYQIKTATDNQGDKEHIENLFPFLAGKEITKTEETKEHNSIKVIDDEDFKKFFNEN